VKCARVCMVNGGDVEIVRTMTASTRSRQRISACRVFSSVCDLS
jgi:hypothetical protein